MFQVHQALSSSKEDDFSLKVFRIAPIYMVAKVPGGKEFSSENCKLIDEAGAYAAVYFLDFVAKNHSNNVWPFFADVKCPRELSRA